MVTEFIPTVSKDIFVGRGQEVQEFKNILQGKSPEWLIYFPGGGGIGKTRLLQKMRQIVEEEKHASKILMTDLLDFYTTILQTELGLLREIVRQLGPKHFPNFRRADQEFLDALQEEQDSVQAREETDKVITGFFEDYRKLVLEGNRIILLFDTCEEMHGIEEWFLCTFLPGIEKIDRDMEGDSPVTMAYLAPSTIVAMAGREEGGKKLDFSALLSRPKSVSLNVLSPKDASSYYQQDPEIGKMIDAKSLKQLYVRTGGHPLHIALSFDWLKNEVGTVDDLLNTAEPFGAELVGWVRRLSVRKKLAIMCMALAWRRMEPSLLAKLVGIPVDEVELLIKELSKFSFIKYREGEFPTIHLHDEMRRLINQYIWPKEQESASIAHQFYPQIAKWYEDNLHQPELFSGKRSPNTDRQRAFLAEWLFYQCQIDLPKSMEYYERLFRNAVHYMDLAFCDLLNQEILRFEGRLMPAQRDDLFFRQALTDFRKDKYPRAERIWNSILATNRNDLLRATTLMLLVELESYTGKPDAAIKHAEEVQPIYIQLREAAQKAEDKKEIDIQFGQLYNNWGYAHRVKGEFGKALEYYKKALKIVDLKTQPDKHRARVLNNMGFVYFKQGDAIRARSYVGRALSIRNKLNIPYELGLGYNTMGMIMEDFAWLQNAVDLYHKAYLAFEEAHSERGKALAKLNQGRINRIVNDYDNAFVDLEYARDVFNRLNDKDQLINALNELGCTYRQRRQEGDPQKNVLPDLVKAIELLNESLKLSRQMGKFFEEVDNLEDISTAYIKLAMDTDENDPKRKEYMELASKHAQSVIDLVDKKEDRQAAYLTGKAMRTLGDIDILAKRYKQAFDHYFESCHNMAVAWAKGGKTSVFLQRQYEDSLDRMQAQLHTLETARALEFSDSIRVKLQHLPLSEKRLMTKLKDYLNATRETAKLAG